MTPGRVIAFDPGSKRIGVAVSDPLRIVASPLEVLDARDPWNEIERLLAEYEPTEIVVGLPIPLSGRTGPSVDRARAFGQELEARCGRSIQWVDERFTTKVAEAALIEGGVKRRDRKRSVDKVAAAVILRHYLTSHP